MVGGNDVSLLGKSTVLFLLSKRLFHHITMNTCLFLIFFKFGLLDKAELFIFILKPISALNSLFGNLFEFLELSIDDFLDFRSLSKEHVPFSYIIDGLVVMSD